MVLSYSNAKHISIVDYLSKLGITPVRINGSSYWYRSPLPNRNERTASFKVNNRLNVWYDHGIGEGGTILDLGMKINRCSLPEFMEILKSRDYPIILDPIIPRKLDESKIEIVSVKDLVSENLISYLQTRSIDANTCSLYCKEVDFKIGKAQYSAVGFQNIAGGFELRNTWFKGSSSPKDISVIKNDSDRLSIVEGFFDFLSLLHVEVEPIKSLVKASDFLILNSLSFIKKSLPIFQTYTQRNVFLDNDEAGHSAKAKLKADGIQFTDGSKFLAGNKDVNDYLRQLNRSTKQNLRAKNIRL